MAFEGHHLSLNYTIVKGRLLSRPLTWERIQPKYCLACPKGCAEKRGRYGSLFLMSLSAKQRKQAIVSDKAPRDIYSSDDPRVYPISNYGIAASELNSKQKDGLAAIIDVYRRICPPVAKERSEKPGAGMDQITFTWAGSPKLAKPITTESKDQPS